MMVRLGMGRDTRSFKLVVKDRERTEKEMLRDVNGIRINSEK